jgi:hypothetical protein
VLTVDVPPVITVNPVNVTVNQGQTASFAVAATGAPATLQWFAGASAISGATNAILTLADVQPAAAGRYSVVITNPAGSVTSSPATLTVDTTPEISSQPESETVTVSQTASFTVVATGIPAPTFAWLKNGVAIKGATNPTLTLTDVQTNAAANYTVAVKNSVATVISSAATLTVDIPPAITTQPANQTVNAGQTATFKVTTTGTPSSAIEWFKTGSALTLATGGTLTLSDVQPAAAGSYFAVATNSLGTATSSAAMLTVDTAPEISSQPESETVTVSQTASFTVVATGIPAPTFAWLKNGVAIKGATNPTLTLAAVPTAAAATYTVVVRNSVATVTSSGAVLTVDVPPAIVTQPVKKTVNQGQAATFSVAATGTPSSTIQWFKTGSASPLVTGGTLTLSSVQPTAAGSYFAVATNGLGTATSSSVSLTVDTLPTLSISPSNQIAAVGTTVSFTAVVTGTPSPTVTWRSNGKSTVLATGTILTLSKVTTASAGSYLAVAVNSVGTVSSSAATLTVVPAAPDNNTEIPTSPGVGGTDTASTARRSIVALALPQPGTSGGGPANSLAASLGFSGPTVILSAAGAGTPGESFQWFKNGLAMEAATTALLVVADAQSTDVGTYTVASANGPNAAASPAGFTIGGLIVPGFKAIAWNGRTFVAVGDIGLVLASPDGSKWSLVYPGTAADFTGLFWDGTSFTAIGTLSQGAGVPPVKVQISSADGNVWTAPMVIP